MTALAGLGERLNGRPMNPKAVPMLPPRIFIVGAVDRMSPEFASGRQSVYGVWGDSVVVSSHSLGCLNDPSRRLPELSYTERAAVESFLALDATFFVGHHLSTFFEGVSRMRQARKRDEGSEFTYSCAPAGGSPPRLLPFRPADAQDDDVAMWSRVHNALAPLPSFSPVPATARVRMQFDRVAWDAEVTCVRLACGGGALLPPRISPVQSLSGSVEWPGVANGPDSLNPNPKVESSSESAWLPSEIAVNAARACIRSILPGYRRMAATANFSRTRGTVASVKSARS
jgi:hypothetical protein